MAVVTVVTATVSLSVQGEPEAPAGCAPRDQDTCEDQRADNKVLHMGDVWRLGYIIVYSGIALRTGR